jgi:tetratricopeptide (TPR) repeat protein
LDLFEEAIDLFYLLAKEDEEDELLYNEWGLALLNIAQLVEDPHQPEKAASHREEAEAKFMHALSLGSSHALYNLACLYSMTGHLDLSISYLEKAKKANALPCLDDLMNDEWLENLRSTDAFKLFGNQDDFS